MCIITSYTDESEITSILNFGKLFYWTVRKIRVIFHWPSKSFVVSKSSLSWSFRGSGPRNQHATYPRALLKQKSIKRTQWVKQKPGRALFLSYFLVVFCLKGKLKFLQSGRRLWLGCHNLTSQKEETEQIYFAPRASSDLEIKISLVIVMEKYW